LVANAGFGHMVPFTKLSDEEIETLVNVNALQVAYVIKTLADQLIERNQKSAIVVTSSGLAAQPFAGHITYSAAKSFASYLAEGLNFEFKGKVDVLSYQAGEVATKMLNRFKEDSRTITPDRAAEACFRDLGYESMTRGSFRHDFGNWFISSLPMSISNPLLFNISKSILKKIRARQGIQEEESKKKK
jgi:short-subunit dehydrogenase